MKKLDFEAKFTQHEYERLAAAVEKREGYEFRYGEYKDKMQVVISGQQCANGVWEPEDYYWSIDMTDKRCGYSGKGCGFHVKEMKTYEGIIDYVYAFFDIEPPTIIQLSFI